MSKYKILFDYFSKIKRCNEIIFKGNTIFLYYYYNITPVTVNLSDISNLVGEVTDNDKVEEESDDDEESVPDVLVDQLGDEYNRGIHFLI